MLNVVPCPRSSERVWARVQLLAGNLYSASRLENGAFGAGGSRHGAMSDIHNNPVAYNFATMVKLG